MKEINEKTFELNITSELLNLSKSFVFYSNLFKGNPHLLKTFFDENVIFAEGLTQKEESQNGGGYDVCINFQNTQSCTLPRRALFLQFKSGVRRKYSTNSNSIFRSGQTNGITSHVMFKFNDAAYRSQHIILRELANSALISAHSVLYVFPRITEKSEFVQNAGNLIWYTSFVPVLELDIQAAEKQITINPGKAHKFRTSYNGKHSEVNYYYYNFEYNEKIIYELLSELICVQIERLLRFYIKNEQLNYKDTIADIRQAVKKAYSINSILKNENVAFIEINQLSIENFLDSLNNKNWESIPDAPSKYTTILSNEKVMILKNQTINFDNFSFQVF